MNLLEFNYGIRSEFPGMPESPTAVGAKFLKMLDALSRADPVFERWLINDVNAFTIIPIEEARPRIAAIIENNVKEDDEGPDPDAGYNAAATTGYDMGPKSMNVSVGAGGTLFGEILLQAGYYGTPPDLALVTYRAFKAGLLAIGAGWPATWACAYAFHVDYDEVPLIPGAPLFSYSQFHIAWIGYLSATLAGGVALPPDIRTEPTPDGGLLIIAAEERLDPTNPEHLRRARIVADTMIARLGTGER